MHTIYTIRVTIIYKNMKTNIGDINNRYSQEKESGRQERFFNTAMNAVTVLIVAFGIGLIISFITIPR